MQNNFTYFQYARELDYPIFIKCDLGHFDASLLNFLMENQFSEVEGKDLPRVQKELIINKKARVLTLKEVSPTLARQIDQVRDSDRFGPESLIPKSGYRVYRYKKMALMVYSLAANEWEMACYSHFGSPDFLKESRVIINRYLSWSLSALGVVGFWGVPVEEGIVVQRLNESKGEAVFVDPIKRKIMTLDGIMPVKAHFSVLRLDSALKNKNKVMKKEELISFLSMHCTFMDYTGLTVSLRQVIKTLAYVADGLVHPEDSFKPRTDLSL